MQAFLFNFFLFSKFKNYIDLFLYGNIVIGNTMFRHFVFCIIFTLTLNLILSIPINRCTKHIDVCDQYKFVFVTFVYCYRSVGPIPRWSFLSMATSFFYFFIFVNRRSSKWIILIRFQSIFLLNKIIIHIM